MFIAVTCQLPRHKGKITWSHGQFCLSWKKIPLILPLIHLHSLASNETKWNERNEVAKQSNDFTNFSSVTFAWTAAALPAGWWTYMAGVIDEKSFHFLFLNQIFLVWQVIHNSGIMFNKEESVKNIVSQDISLYLSSFSMKFSWKIKRNNHLAPPWNRSALFLCMIFFVIVHHGNYINYKIIKLSPIKAI